MGQVSEVENGNLWLGATGHVDIVLTYIDPDWTAGRVRNAIRDDTAEINLFDGVITDASGNEIASFEVSSTSDVTLTLCE